MIGAVFEAWTMVQPYTSGVRLFIRETRVYCMDTAADNAVECRTARWCAPEIQTDRCGFQAWTMVNLH